jgi:tetratricopeptide (TPR) repeat protein
VDKSDLDAIERKLIEGIALDPDDKDFNSRLADLYFWTGNHKKALTLLRKNLDIIPDDHKTLWQISEIHIKQGDYDQAQIIIAQAIVKESNNPKYYMTQAEALYKTKDIQ